MAKNKTISKSKDLINERVQKRAQSRKSPEQIEAEATSSKGRQLKLLKLQEKRVSLEESIKDSVIEINKLISEEANLSVKEPFSEQYARFLKTSIREANKEAMTNERAMEIIKANAIKSPLDKSIAKKNIELRKNNYTMQEEE